MTIITESPSPKKFGPNVRRHTQFQIQIQAFEIINPSASPVKAKMGGGKRRKTAAVIKPIEEMKYENDEMEID